MYNMDEKLKLCKRCEGRGKVEKEIEGCLSLLFSPMFLGGLIIRIFISIFIGGIIGIIIYILLKKIIFKFYFSIFFIINYKR